MFEAKWYIILSKQEKAHQAIDLATREAFFSSDDEAEAETLK